MRGLLSHSPKLLGKCSWRGNQIRESWRQGVVGRDLDEVNDMGPAPVLDVPSPWASISLEKLPAALASSECPLLAEPGQSVGPRSSEVALTHGRALRPASYGEALGAGPSWGSWCHAGISALGRLTDGLPLPACARCKSGEFGLQDAHVRFAQSLQSQHETLGSMEFFYPC